MSDPRVSQQYKQEIEAEKERLVKVFQELTNEQLVISAKRSRLGIEGTADQLINRLVRFDLRRLYGPNAAPWDPVVDNADRRGSASPSISPDELLLSDTNSMLDIQNGTLLKSTRKESWEMVEDENAESLPTAEPNATIVPNASNQSTMSTSNSNPPIIAPQRPNIPIRPSPPLWNPEFDYTNYGPGFQQQWSGQPPYGHQLFNSPFVSAGLAANQQKMTKQSEVLLLVDKEGAQAIRATHQQTFEGQTPGIIQEETEKGASPKRISKVNFENRTSDDRSQAIQNTLVCDAPAAQSTIHPTRTHQTRKSSNIRGNLPTENAPTVNQSQNQNINPTENLANPIPAYAYNQSYLHPQYYPYNPIHWNPYTYPPNGMGFPQTHPAYPPENTQARSLYTQPENIEVHRTTQIPLRTTHIPESNPSRFGQSARVNRTSDFSSTHDSTYQRETQTCNLLQRWKVIFAGEPREDAEEFLERLKECQECMGFPDEEILKMIPAILTGAARYWARPLYRSWRTIDDFEESLRLQYGVPDFQLRLEDEIRARTQGPDESIGSYLSGLRLLMDKLIPKTSSQAQLDRAYRNLHPEFIRSIKRDQFRTFQELQALGQQEEVRRERERTYRPPPAPEQSLFPEVAYKARRRNKLAAIEPFSEDSEDEAGFIAAVPEPKQERESATRWPKQNRNEYSNKNNNTSKINTSPQNGPKAKNWQNKNSQKQNNPLPNPLPNPVQNSLPQHTSRENTTTKSTLQISRNQIQNGNSPTKRIFPCWVCKSNGHWAKECPNKKGKLCYKCGHPDVIIATCPNCSSLTGNAQGGRR